MLKSSIVYNFCMDCMKHFAFQTSVKESDNCLAIELFFLLQCNFKFHVYLKELTLSKILSSYIILYNYSIAYASQCLNRYGWSTIDKINKRYRNLIKCTWKQAQLAVATGTLQLRLLKLKIFFKRRYYSKHAQEETQPEAISRQIYFDSIHFPPVFINYHTPGVSFPVHKVN